MLCDMPYTYEETGGEVAAVLLFDFISSDFIDIFKTQKLVSKFKQMEKTLSRNLDKVNNNLEGEHSCM